MFNTPSSRPDILKKINGPLVISNLTSYAELDSDAYKNAGFSVNTETKEIVKTDSSADLIISSNLPDNFPGNVSLIIPFKKWDIKTGHERLFPLFSPETFHERTYQSDILNVLLTGSHFNIEYLKKPDPATTLIIFTFNPEKERYAADIFLNSLARKQSCSQCYSESCIS